MKFRLHELELFSKDPMASRRFYGETLGLKLNLTLHAGLNVFDAGIPGVDFDTSVHRPGKTTVSFITDDLDGFVDGLRKRGVAVPDPEPAHLRLRCIALEDPDGNAVFIQGMTAETPKWLRDQMGF
jgi:catechol 2,3-dioxygenase-like lactoylglutathione lyase family enzyme